MLWFLFDKMRDKPASISIMRDYQTSNSEMKTAATSKVIIATTETEKEEIYRLRYEIYIEETHGKRRHTEANVPQRRFRDELDQHAHQVYCRPGSMRGCLRR